MSEREFVFMVFIWHSRVKREGMGGRIVCEWVKVHESEPSLRSWVNKWVLQVDFYSWSKSVWWRTVGFEWTVKVCLYSIYFNNGWFFLVDLHTNSEFVIIKNVFFLLSSTLFSNLHFLLLWLIKLTTSESWNHLK